MSGWVIDPVPALRGYAVEWVDEQGLVLSRRNHLYRAATPDAEKQHLASFPAPRWQSETTRLRLAQRLLRFFYYNVMPLPDGGLFATFAKSVGILRSGEFLPVTGLEGPCRVLRSACTLGEDGGVWFGEYFGNPGRETIRIYRCDPASGHAEVAHAFEPGVVRHVHGIYRDPMDGALWCTTGDREGECRVMRTTDGFASIDVVGAGDESWRCVGLAFSDDAIYYGTDAEFEQNHLYRIDRRSGERRILGELDGPVFYTYGLGRDLFFAVTAELCPSQVGRSATLWHLSERDELQRVGGFEKDRFPIRFFMYGSLHFPHVGSRSSEVWVHGVALQGADDRSFVLRRNA